MRGDVEGEGRDAKHARFKDLIRGVFWYLFRSKNIRIIQLDVYFCGRDIYFAEGGE